MEPFVCVHLLGGLGNQLFQYAAAKTVSEAKNCKLFVNKETENSHNVNGHNYAKELFVDAEEVDWPRGALGDWVFQSNGVHVVSQQDGFAPWDPTSIEVPCVLSGYFQYYPAIQNTLPSIRKTLMLSKYVCPDEKATFLHVRRGDYVEKSDFHFLQGKEYYEKALARLNPSKVLVFSDDIEWCKTQDWLISIPCVEFVEEKDEIKTFFRMVSCKEGGILANSTFSWWAAVISDVSNVTYPSRWVNQKLSCLFPPNWICID